jgi:hypothetical protein
VHAFRLPHALHIGLPFSESLDISSTHLSLGFGILLLLLLDLIDFSDADFAGYGIDRNSTSGTCHFFVSSLVCWSSRKQSTIAQSTTEVEYVATTLKFYGLCTP